MHYCDHALSVRRSSVVVNFSHFRLLLWNHWTEFIENWQEARTQHTLPSLCFSGRSKNKMAALASDWLRHFRPLLWNHWMEFNETWQEARSQRLLPSLCFSGPIGKNKMVALACDWLRHFSTSPLKPLNGIQRNLTGSNISTSSTKFVFLGRSEKQDAAPASDWLRHFRLLFWNRWTEFDKTWQKSLCFSGRSENKMAALASDWLRNFRLLLSNRWKEFNETWQEARSQRPLPSLCF